MSSNQFEDAFTKLKECADNTPYINYNILVHKLLFYAVEMGLHANSKEDILRYEFYRRTAKTNNMQLYYLLPDVFGTKIDSFGSCFIDYIVECKYGNKTELPTESAKYNATITAAMALDEKDAEEYYLLLSRLDFENRHQIITQLYSRYLELTGIKWDLSNIDIESI